jgi:hypothetical protein
MHNERRPSKNGPGNTIYFLHGAASIGLGATNK